MSSVFSNLFDLFVNLLFFSKKVLRLVDALEDNDDVQDVYGNFDIPDELMDEL